MLPNRKHLPIFFKKAKELEKILERGQHKSDWVLNNKVRCYLWKDSKIVGFVDTFYNNSDQTTVTRKLGDGSRTVVWCPEGVKLYNQYMGGVDLLINSEIHTWVHGSLHTNGACVFFGFL